MWICTLSSNPFEETFENSQWRLVKQMQPVWLCILTGRSFEETFENAQWRKVKQMHLLWFGIFLGRPFEETSEDTQWRKDKQMQPMWYVDNLREAIWGDILKHIWRISFQNSLSPLEAWEKNIHFSFSSQKSRICFQISLSLLKVGEQHFKFLCLFSKMVN